MVRKEIWHGLGVLKARGQSILVIDKNLGALMKLADRHYVMEKGELEKAPYIVAFGDQHIVGGAGQRAYVRSIEQAEPLKYEIVRPGGPYKDAETGEILGYEAQYVASSQLQRTGDPATVFINTSKVEAIIGDRLMPAGEDRATASFTPHAPAMPTEGSIISVFNGVSQIGQYNIVVIDRGARDGLEPGTVLRVDQLGETVRDVVTPDSRDTVKLPDEHLAVRVVDPVHDILWLRVRGFREPVQRFFILPDQRMHGSDEVVNNGLAILVFDGFLQRRIRKREAEYQSMPVVKSPSCTSECRLFTLI